MCKILQVFCALDETLIEILAPNNERKTDYFAGKKLYTVNTQGIVRANLLFLHLAIGFLGSSHDDRVCVHYRKYKTLNRGQQH